MFPRYITIDPNTSKLSASGSHPFLQINETPLEMSPKVLFLVLKQKIYLIINSQNSDYAGPLIFRS